MIKIYHNTRCRKSREAVEYLKEKKIKFTIIEYLKVNFTIEEMSMLISKLDINPINIVRKNEVIWKEKFKNLKHSDMDIINLLVSNPKLIERPIIEDSNKAVIGRYILSNKIFSKLKNLKPNKGGEIHITDALQLLINDNEKFIAHNFSGKYLDCGSMEGYINSSKEIAKL